MPLYEFPSQKIVLHYLPEMPIRTSALRTLGAYANVFALESFMDELAVQAGVDPVAFRLKHMKDARARAVIERETGYRARFSHFPLVGTCTDCLAEEDDHHAHS